MEIYDKLIKPIKEVNYLRVDNVARYRIIMRYFFNEYEKINYWLNKEDVYSMMIQIKEFENYTKDQCVQDLQSLVDWGNLIADQDNKKVKTIEDFKNRQFRYQLSEYSVEIERMTIKLEHLEVEGSSLEPTLLERIYKTLKELEIIKKKQENEIHGWFNYLMTDFIRLNQNYQDYIKTLNSAKAEELMKTEAFLLYKDKLISYLRTFVKTMQETGTLITLQLQSISKEDMEDIFLKATEYELSIPRLDIQLNEEEVLKNYKDKWTSLYKWFVGENDYNEMDRLNDITNEIIRKITRYAQQIVEMNNRGSNRKEQYHHIAEIFLKCKDINEAHCLSAYVFGVSDCLHLNHINPRLTDNIDGGVYEENPSSLSFESHSRIMTKKAVRKPAKDYSLEKKMQQIQIEKELQEKKDKISKLINDNIIDFSTLPKIDSDVRQTLLNWLSKGLQQANNSNKTEDGRKYYIDETHKNRECTLKCNDGLFVMPAYKIVFNEENGYE
jgi:uncharacterized protein (TIGR02677 family)